MSLETLMMIVIWYALVLFIVKKLAAPVDDELKMKNAKGKMKEF